MMKLPRVAYDQVKWYGRGPWENYPDRKQSCPIGWYESSVEDQFTHYPVRRTTATMRTVHTSN